MTGFASVFGPLCLPFELKKRFIMVSVPWAFRCANNTVDLMSVYFEKHFEEDFEEFKQRIGAIKFPKNF